MTRVLKTVLLLACTHIQLAEVEGAIFLPKLGEKKVCSRCGQTGEIIRVGIPYWETLDDIPNDTSNNLNMFEKE